MGKQLSDDELQKLPKTKEEAISIGAIYFYTGKPCQNGHVAQRKVSDGRCFICLSNSSKRQRTKNPEKQAAFNAKRRTRKYKDRQNKINKQRRAKDPNYRKDRRGMVIKRYYGISNEDYDELLSKQNDKCGICGAPEGSDRGEYFSIDHDHKTQAVRGLLCSPCNKLLGNAKDNKDTLRNTIIYLERDVDYRDDTLVCRLLEKVRAHD